MLEKEIVELSTIVIFALSAVLAFYLTVNGRSISTRFWSSGMWMFALGVFLEVIFAYGIYSQFLIKLYLLVVALVVELLAMGSINLTGKRVLIVAYYAYSVVSTLSLVLSLVYSDIGNIITNFVVYGSLPVSVVVTSSIVTFPAAAILIAVAAISYRKKHSYKMLSIIAGTLIVSVAGTLYIAQFPAFLYYAEFFGVLFLWLGFFDFRKFSSHS